jgi:acyl carrier protein
LGGAPFEHRGLDLDSLDRIEIVMQLEETFELEIPDDDFAHASMNTPAGIIEYVEGRLGVQPTSRSAAA